MLKTLLVLSTLNIALLSHGQYAQSLYTLFPAKEFSKEKALYTAKEFVMVEVLGNSNNVVQFEIDPLAATSSGELTSLVYQCDQLKKEGLIFGFFGNRWNDAGVTYQAYAFKNIPSDSAKYLLEKIETLIESNSKYLNKDDGANNIYFHFGDMKFLIYKDVNFKIRVFWQGFDSEWQMIAFKRTKNRLYKKLE